ncbi:hypothetical protein PR048_020170 [Dryococelus australis]|uniref:Integrase zinc-binding domain-containing protein n=1 Tax=Dryococelus australis TaxID=614101 RepID=A0ABQ9H5K1_9NEOP|nr:hypothetical protein PR048_020170 [Dryococelus australis]
MPWELSMVGGVKLVKLKQEDWRKFEVKVNHAEVQSKRRKMTTSSANPSPKKEAQCYLQEFSKLSQIVKLIVWMLRFHKNDSKNENRRAGNLDVEDIYEAERRLLHLVQREEEEKIDITMPRFHMQILLEKLQEWYWNLRGRNMVRLVISKCVWCRRVESRKITTNLAPHSEDRLNDASVFEVCRVDMVGPLKDISNQAGEVPEKTAGGFEEKILRRVLGPSGAAEKWNNKGPKALEIGDAVLISSDSRRRL